ncbi:hypothetical protein [Pseudomonas sp. QTF5]|uniref:hypothetical protein n=1 Tax=Pseudomonas sp. QTF5 TaxID=1435425 RepID=UPI0004BCE570|nr:hypothetical protein [Pseudomonas sp. QTF5]
MSWKIWMVLLAMVGAGSSHAGEIDFSSADDFIRMEMLLKDDDGANPDHVTLSVTLSPQAAEHAQKISRESLGQPLTVSINGHPISTATVRSALGAQFRIAMSRSIAKKLLPTLIE